VSRVDLFSALDLRSDRNNLAAETMTDWTIATIPPQRGKLAVVTGATGGLGYQTAIRLAQAGAEVVLTGRNEAKGREAVSKIRNQFPDAKISLDVLDLANLASVTDFARSFATAHSSLDLLINRLASWLCPPGRPRPTVSKCSSEPTISVTTR
jgi:NAD(P)-dependent dehydrogenase (short-subunit alcohol dehydrogenase family)